MALLAALGCGLVGRVFFAFSNFVMKALARIPDDQGMRAMQSINVTVLNPVFLGLFVGTAALCAVIAVTALLHWQSPGSAYLLTGSALYLVGNLFVTRAFNIPRNEALAQRDASSAEGAKLWRDYVVEWTRWNHLRTITALAAAASLTIGLCRGS